MNFHYVQIRSQYLLLDCVSKLHSLQQFLHHTCVPCHHINIHIQPRYTHFKAFTTLYNSWFSRSHECSETREALRSYSNAHVLPCTFRITNTTHNISHTRVKCLDKNHTDVWSQTNASRAALVRECFKCFMESTETVVKQSQSKSQVLVHSAVDGQ